jgi:DNA-binding beta-propeller fold protein YncE
VVSRAHTTFAALSAATALASCADVLGLKDFELEPDGGVESGATEGGIVEDSPSDDTAAAADAADSASGDDSMAPPEGAADVETDGPLDSPADVTADVRADVPCVGSMTDPRNCGACGHDCEGGSCTGGECQPFVLKSGVNAFDVVSDGTTLYWVDGKTGGSVGRCGATTCTPSAIVSARPMPIRVALDAAGILFWTEYGTGTTTDGSVWTLAGSTPTPIATHRYAPEGIFADTSYVYWAEVNANELVRDARSGGVPTMFGGTQQGPVGIVLDGAGRAYWTASNGGTVDTCPVANCAAATTSLVSGRTSPWGIAIDATYLYFTELTASGSVMRCDHGGGALTMLGGGPQSSPLRIVSDGTHVYWTNEGSGPGTGSVMRCTDTTCAPIATGLASPAGIAVDARAIYYGTMGDSTIWKVVK